MHLELVRTSLEFKTASNPWINMMKVLKKKKSMWGGDDLDLKKLRYSALL